MNRPRSVSRHPSLRPKDDSVSPTRSRSRPPSAASSYRDSDRPRSRPRAPHARQQREQVAGNGNGSSSSSSGLSRSAGVLAGIGIAALVARRLWPKGSGADEKKDRGSDGGRSHHTRRDGAKEQAPRGRDVERRVYRPAGHVPSREHGQGRLAMRAEYHPDYHLREPRRRSMDRRSRGSQDAQSQMQSSSGYGRRYS